MLFLAGLAQTLLSENVAKVCTSPRNLNWFTRLVLLMRGWGLGTTLRGEPVILCVLLITSLYQWTWLIDSSHNNYPLLFLHHLILLVREHKIPRWLKLPSMLNRKTCHVLYLNAKTEHSRCWICYTDVLQPTIVHIKLKKL